MEPDPLRVAAPPLILRNPEVNTDQWTSSVPLPWIWKVTGPCAGLGKGGSMTTPPLDTSVGEGLGVLVFVIVKVAVVVTVEVEVHVAVGVRVDVEVTIGVLVAEAMLMVAAFSGIPVN